MPLKIWARLRRAAAYLLLLTVALALSACAGCESDGSGSNNSTDAAVDAGSDTQGDGRTDADAIDDTGSDTESDADTDSGVSATGPTRLIPVSGTGQATSTNHKLQLKIGRPVGTADADVTLELGGQP
ncbi:MAG: hypothetical protein ACQEVA_20970 [Myxococcota bacterium]